MFLELTDASTDDMSPFLRRCGLTDIPLWDMLADAESGMGLRRLINLPDL